MMQIKKGTVSYQGRNDWECLYGEVGPEGNQVQYYFMDNGSLPNGNFIASTHLVEAIDREVQTRYIGLIDSEGNVLIPFENKSIKAIPGDILLVEKTNPTTASVLEAIDLKKDPLAATRLVSTPAAIKDRMNAQMGADGRYLFNDQFSEASIFDFNGNNLINDEYFSFIGISNGKLYFTKNTIDGPITEYSILPAEVRDEVVVEDEIDVQSTAVNNGAAIEQLIGEEVQKQEKELMEENSEGQATEEVVENSEVPEIPEATMSNEEAVESNEAVTPNEEVIENNDSVMPVEETEENVNSVEGETISETNGMDVHGEAVEQVNNETESMEQIDGAVDEANVETVEKEIENTNPISSVIPTIKTDSVEEEKEEPVEEEKSEEIDEIKSIMEAAEDGFISNDEVSNELEKEFEMPIDEDVDLNIDTSDVDLEMTDSDVFGESILKADNIDVSEFDFDDNLDSIDNSNDNLIEKTTEYMSKLIDANREQQNKISEYEIEHKKLANEVRSLRQANALLTNKNKKYEPIVAKAIVWREENQVLNARVLEQEQTIKAQNRELKLLKAQVGNTEKLLKVIKDADDLFGRDNYTATDNEGNYSIGLAA